MLVIGPSIPTATVVTECQRLMVLKRVTVPSDMAVVVRVMNDVATDATVT
jgi:hypothetical protein